MRSFRKSAPLSKKRTLFQGGEGVDQQGVRVVYDAKALNNKVEALHDKACALSTTQRR
jgi:hypothetical protein